MPRPRPRGGGRRNGPDLSWEDDALAPEIKKPEPLFPDLDPELSVPRPLSRDEIERVDHYLAFRDRIRSGPFYAVLGPNSFIDGHGKFNKRAGFDPFTGMEKYGSRFDKPQRTVPELAGRQYNLEYFPRELWSTLDPKRTNPAWRTHRISSTITTKSPAAKKRKRPTAPLPNFGTDSEPSDAESDAPIASKRRKRPARQTDDRQKPGLEAEDDIPDVDQNEEEDDGQGSELEDREYTEDEGGDYDAEGYFSGGDRDEDDGGGGDEGGDYE